MKLPIAALSSGLCLLGLLAACSGGGEATPAPGPGDQPEAPLVLPESFWAAESLGDALDVKAIRDDEVADGDEVVIRGTLQDFGELATFKLVEDSLEHCGEMDMEDNCATPWDYCCEEPSVLGRYTVNVEFLDGDYPGAWQVQGFHGLERLTEVVIAGVLRRDEVDNLRVEASKIALQ